MMKWLLLGVASLLWVGLALYVFLPAVTGLIFSQPITIITNPFIDITPQATATPTPKPRATSKPQASSSGGS